MSSRSEERGEKDEEEANENNQEGLTQKKGTNERKRER